MTTPTTLVLRQDGEIRYANEFATREEAENAVLGVMHKIAAAYSASHAFEHEGWTADYVARDNPRPYGDDWEADAFRKHFEKYDNYAHRLGLASLRSLVVARKAGFLNALAAGDHALNTIPLAWWDSMDPIVRRFAREAGIRSWSLGDTVCTLKHVARHYVAGGAATIY